MDIFGYSVNQSAVSLARYARIIGYTEWAFFGFSTPDNDRYECREIWTKSQRDDISLYLAEAQDEIEAILQYPLQKKWFTDERHPARLSAITEWAKLIAAGTMAVSIIEDDAAVDISTDPATVTISPVSAIADLSEIKILYPDTDIEITPSNIIYDSGTATLVLYIPLARLMSYTLLDNPESGVIPDATSFSTTYQLTVDVHRVYTDPTVQAKLVYRDQCLTSFCSDQYDSVCEYLYNPDIGEIHVPLHSHMCQSTCYKSYSHVLLNYCAGIPKLTRQTEQMIVRLAHSKMPTEPCGCEVTQRLWRRDRNIPQLLTKDRIDCPFGMSDGAWIAWRWACGLEVKRMSNMIGVSNVKI
jgi:uncharacterized protein YqiB (DUF1249 family)